MTELRIDYVPLDELKPDPRNPKAHDHRALTESFEQFGNAEAVVVDERTGLLVSGHGRVETLRRMAEARPTKPPTGVTRKAGRWHVPVQRGWSSRDDEEAMAFLVAANATTERGGWDDQALYTILEGLGSDGLIGTGFDEASMDDIRARLEEVAATEGANTSAEFQAKQVRSLILEYTVEDFTDLTARAMRVRRKLGVESNAELFLTLLEKAAG